MRRAVAMVLALCLAACDDAQVANPVAIGGASSDGGASADASVGVDAAADEDARVASILAAMSLDEKVGQITIASYDALRGASAVDDITTYALGGLGGAPEGLGAPDWLALTATARAKAAATRAKIPVLIAIDAVHGNAKVRGATVFPHDIGLGCARDPDLVARIEAATAEEVLALGITTNWSPDLDVGRDARWGRTYESFGEDPDLVSTMGRAAIAGYQGSGLGTHGAVMAVPKHALGSGGTAWGTGATGGVDRGDVVVDEAEMRRVHLPPFKAAIEAGAMAIMVSYCSFHGTKMSASPYWLTDVIKGELGFSGMLVSDGNAIYQLPGTTEDQARLGLEAGLDMFIVGGDYKQFIDDAKHLVASGVVPEARLDDAVRRVLRVKLRAGLFDAPAPDPTGASVVGSTAHRVLAREAVRKSAVLLKNDGAILPLRKSARIHVAGRGANDVGIQSGGWTLAWAGVTDLDPATFGGGTTILQAVQRAAVGGAVTFSADGTGASGAEVGVVILHEVPYVEYVGDVPDPRFDSTANAHVYDGTVEAAVANMRTANVPLVAVLVTGRPVRIEALLPSFRAVVAVWLPGSEADGIADLLFGDAKFTGVLSKSWPKDATPLPLTHDSSPYDPLFPFGFGLTD
jgi:beta-glucosidase